MTAFPPALLQRDESAVSSVNVLLTINSLPYPLFPGMNVKKYTNVAPCNIDIFLFNYFHTNAVLKV